MTKAQLVDLYAVAAIHVVNVLCFTLITELYMSISVQALVDLCCVTVTKFVETTDDFRLSTDIRQTIQRYYSGCVCSLEI